MLYTEKDCGDTLTKKCCCSSYYDFALRFVACYNNSMKPCSVCSELKPLATRSSRCKDCHNAYTRQHYADNKQAYVDKARRNNEKVREQVRRAKEKPCSDCGVKYPYYVMDFDHLSNKSFNISEQMAKVGWTKLKQEIDKCDVVCSNCHRARTFQRL